MSTGINVVEKCTNILECMTAERYNRKKTQRCNQNTYYNAGHPQKQKFKKK